MVVFEDPSIDSGNLVGGFLDFIRGALDSGDGSIFGIGFLLTIGVVSFMASKDYSYDRAMGVSGFISVVSGFILLKLGWISGGVFMLAIIWFVLGLYFLIKDRGGEEL